MSFKGVRPSESHTSRGKTIRQLINELKTFENQDLEARISLDGGETHHPISLLGRHLNDMNGDGHICVIQYQSED